MSLDIFIPAMRKHKLVALIGNIEETTRTPHETHVAATPDVVPDGLTRFTFWPDNGGTYAERINKLYESTTGDYFFLGADDIKFHYGWAEYAWDVMNKVDGVVVVNDLHNPVGTHVLISRAYIKEFGSGTMDDTGAVLHEGYKHCYCDVELFEVAKQRGRFGVAPKSIVEHMHMHAGKAPDDAVYRLGASSYLKDGKRYQSRRHLWA